MAGGESEKVPVPSVTSAESAGQGRDAVSMMIWCASARQEIVWPLNRCRAAFFPQLKFLKFTLYMDS